MLRLGIAGIGAIAGDYIGLIVGGKGSGCGAYGAVQPK